MLAVLVGYHWVGMGAECSSWLWCVATLVPACPLRTLTSRAPCGLRAPCGWVSSDWAVRCVPPAPVSILVAQLTLHACHASLPVAALVSVDWCAAPSNACVPALRQTAGAHCSSCVAAEVPCGVVVQVRAAAVHVLWEPALGGFIIMWGTCGRGSLRWRSPHSLEAWTNPLTLAVGVAELLGLQAQCLHVCVCSGRFGPVCSTRAAAAAVQPCSVAGMLRGDEVLWYGYTAQGGRAACHGKQRLVLFPGLAGGSRWLCCLALLLCGKCTVATSATNTWFVTQPAQHIAVHNAAPGCGWHQGACCFGASHCARAWQGLWYVPRGIGMPGPAPTHLTWHLGGRPWQPAG